MEMPEGLITMCWARMSKVFDSLDNKIQSVKDVMSVELHKAYNDGYEAAKKELAGKTYEQGLNDAWECALKVGMHGCEYYKNNVFPKHPNYDVWDIIRHYPAAEAIAKIKEYEKELVTFNVGDEVHFYDSNRKYIITSLLEAEKGVFISANGKYTTNYLSQAVKTGKHYSELEKILDDLKGNKDE